VYLAERARLACAFINAAWPGNAPIEAAGTDQWVGMRPATIWGPAEPYRMTDAEIIAMAQADPWASPTFEDWLAHPRDLFAA
jgi:hypothetical protein